MTGRQGEDEDRREGGFTLIELLIVIVVLGILAAVVVFGLSGVTSESAQATCSADARTVTLAQEAYHLKHGVWASETQLTVPDADGIIYLRAWPRNSAHYVIHTSSGAGVVTVQANDGKGALLVGATDHDATPDPCLKVR